MDGLTLLKGTPTEIVTSRRGQHLCLFLDQLMPSMRICRHLFAKMQTVQPPAFATHFGDNKKLTLWWVVKCPVRSSYQATGVWKSRGFAKLLAPVRPFKQDQTGVHWRPLCRAAGKGLGSIRQRDSMPLHSFCQTPMFLQSHQKECCQPSSGTACPCTHSAIPRCCRAQK